VSGDDCLTGIDPTVSSFFMNRTINLPFIRRKIRINAEGWPWMPVCAHWASRADGTAFQKYGWNPFSVKGMGRFGGGWAFKFGVEVDASLQDWSFYLGLGYIRITLSKKVQP
jgi:hypothetical protein